MNQNSVSISLKLNRIGWKFFYFQSFFQIFLFIAFIPCYFFLLDINSLALVLSFIYLIYLLFAIFLILSIVLISISPFIYLDYPDEDISYTKKSKLILFIGILWLLLSLFGLFQIRVSNFSFFGQLGFVFLNGIAYLKPLDVYDLFMHPLIRHNFLSIIPLIFFFLQDNNYLYKKQITNSRGLPRVSIGTIYGLLFFFSDLISYLFFLPKSLNYDYLLTNQIVINDHSIALQFLILLVLKFLVVPTIGMQTARKFLSCREKEKPSKPFTRIPFKKSVFLWLRNVFSICDSIRIWPQNKIVGFFFIIITLLLLIPTSPFYFLETVNFTPTVIGPHIARNVTGEALEVLQYVENIPLNDIIELPSQLSYFCYYSDCFMCNSTLNYFLNSIPTLNPTEHLDYQPSDSYWLEWSVNVEETNNSLFNTTFYHQQWPWLSNAFLVIWENDSQNTYSDIRRINLTTPVKWIFYGNYRYYLECGSLCGLSIDAKQIIIIDKDLNLVLFAFIADIGVS